MPYDNSVLRDAAAQLRAAAYRLERAMMQRANEKEQDRLVGEARALLYAAEARIK